MTGATPDKARHFRRRAVWGVLAFALCLSALIHIVAVLTYPHLDMPLGPPSPDAWMRLAQVRQWLQGGWAGFYDHAVRRTNAPYGGIAIHWTRPVDSILSALYFLTPPGMDANIRLMLAASVMPGALCFIAVMLLAKTARQHFNHTHVVVCAALFAIFNSWLADYYSPGDADHHGFMSTLWSGVVMLLVSGKRFWLLGGLLGLIIWTSPEGLVLTAAVYGVLGLEALLYPEKAGRLAEAAIGAAIVSAFGLLVEQPVGEILSHPAYDVLSIVYVTLLSLCAVAATGLAILFRQKISLAARFCATFVAGGSVLVAMYLLYPKIFQGALVDADRFIFSDFLPQVSEARPLFLFPWEGLVLAVAPILLSLFLLAVSLRRWRALRPDKRRWLLVMSALLTVTVTLTLFQIRWEYYVQPLVIAICAALLPGVSVSWRGPKFCRNRPPPRQWRPYVSIALFVAGMTLVGRAHPAAEMPGFDVCENQVRYVLQTQQLPPLLGSDDLILLETANAGGDALFFTPYRIIAANYHREGKGLHDLQRIWLTPTAEATHAIIEQRHVGAMLVCPSHYPAKSWLSRIDDRKKYPHWLKPVHGLKFFEAEGLDTSKNPILFRINE